MTRPLLTASLLAPLAFWPASVPAAPTDLHGLCFRANATSTPSKDLAAPLDAYCAALREGRKRLADDPAAAFDRFGEAVAVAGRFTEADDRARAADEARAGQALALEAGGEPEAGLQAMLRPSASAPDVIGLARAFMLARRGQYHEAAEGLGAALPQVGAGCAPFQRAWEHLRRNEPTGIDPIYKPMDFSAGQYLPSWWEGCSAKAALGGMPEVRSYHIDFDLGAATWPDTEANRRLLEGMTQVITRNELGETDGKVIARKDWRLTGHADQTCPKSGDDCDLYNNDLSRRRAEAVKRHLIQALRGRLPDLEQRLQATGLGRQRPLYDTGREDRRNRRVDLGAVAEQQSDASTECPWEVRVYDSDLPGTRSSGDIAALPPRLLRQGETVTVGRGSAFELRLNRSLASAGGWSYFYATSEDQRTRLYDLNTVGGAGNGALAEFAGVLPVRRAEGRLFVLSPGATQETLQLTVSHTPISNLENLRANQQTALSQTAAAPQTQAVLSDDEKVTVTNSRGQPLGSFTLANATEATPRVKGAQPITPSGVGPRSLSRRPPDQAAQTEPPPPIAPTPSADLEAKRAEAERLAREAERLARETEAKRAETARLVSAKACRYTLVVR